MKLTALPSFGRGTCVRYCWREDWCVPHESLWCRLHKFSVLNVISGKEAHTLLRTTPRGRRHHGFPESKRHRRGDLRVRGDIWDEHKIRAALRLSPVEGWGTISDFLPHAEQNAALLTLYSSKILRYCPHCIANGIHTSYMQLYFVNNCPAHGVPLAEECPACREQIMYERPGVHAPFQCACGHFLWDWRSDLMPKITDQLKRDHATAGAWLVAASSELDRTLIGADEIYNFWQNLREHGVGDVLVRQISKLATFISIAAPELGRLAHNFCEETARNVRREVISDGSPAQGRIDSSVFASTYNGLRKYLYEKTFKKHRAFIEDTDVVVDYFRKPNTLRIAIPRSFEPAALAFVAWSDYCRGRLVEPETRKHHDRLIYPTADTFRRLAFLTKGFPFNSRRHVAVRWSRNLLHGIYDEFHHVLTEVAAAQVGKDMQLNLDRVSGWAVPSLHVRSNPDGVVLTWLEVMPKEQRLEARYRVTPRQISSTGKVA